MSLAGQQTPASKDNSGKMPSGESTWRKLRAPWLRHWMAIPSGRVLPIGACCRLCRARGSHRGPHRSARAGAPRAGGRRTLLRQADDPARALTLLRQDKPADMAAAFQWAQAAEQARIYLLSGLPADTVEELFAVPLQHAGQVQRLLDEGGSVLVLNDAHKLLAIVQA